jgi:CheY-like chemotaxis protein
MLPDGGRLCIETANVWFDERAAREQGLAPGQYISICVTDSGSGMSPEVQARAFDPFFTTKPLGQGTGLGLSMVYGFVRQSGGSVTIDSQLGRGTTVCKHLPRYAGEAEVDRTGGMLVPAEPGAGETVVLIEDEPTIRILVTEVLHDSGYRVIAAEDGQTGLAILEKDGPVDLLITDVGLPGGLNGRQVADAARVGRPELKVLFITGYAENAAVGNGLMEPGMGVLTKPFEIAALAKKVRDMVEGSRAELALSFLGK